MKNFCTPLLALLAASLCHANDKPLDFWVEGTRLFGVASKSQHVNHSLDKRQSVNYNPQGIELDHSDHVQGDLSITYIPAKVGMAPRFGFVSSLWGETWALSATMQFKAWIKTEGTQTPTSWTLRLLDTQNREATGTLQGTATSGEWKQLTLPLNELKTSDGFDWQQVALCEFEADFSADAEIRFDGVHFAGDNKFVGITDKPISQRMAEAKKSRTTRVQLALKNAAKKDAFDSVSAFAKMMLNEDLENANQMLVEALNDPKVAADPWSLIHTPLFCRFYYMFSNRYGKFPGRMTPATEKLLLETLWKRTAAKNDIAWARQSTWYLDGSENHDLNAKVCNLVTARIFMNEPDYKDRIYPDYGFGGSYHYGRAGYYGPDIDPESRHGGGRTNLADGKEYNAKDHYEAWLVFLKEYFKGRAERGFFLEYGSSGYTKHSMNMVDLAYQYSGDPELHETLSDFMTLFWAEWAQVSISGVRGGPKTRHHHTVMEGDGTRDLITFHLGGPANGACWWYWNLINDYTLPEVVWNMALDRTGMGEFTYRARGIGEEPGDLPRPLGTERTLIVDTDARFLKQTHVTPDYTLGTQMDHPSAIHSHLSSAGRWHGMTFAESETARIVPVSIPIKSNKKGKLNAVELEVVYKTVQHARSLILQQARRWYGISPEWFPSSAKFNQAIGIWFGSDWDQQEERAGWVFVQKGNAYAAVRPVLWDEAYEKTAKKKTGGTQGYFNAPDDLATVKLRDDCYKWNHDKTILLLEDSHSPVIFEAGRVADHPSLEAFIADVLDNPIKLYKTVVPGHNILTYTGCADGAKEIVFNASNQEIPTVAGKPINYSYPMTFDSPYIRSDYKSGQIHIEYGGSALDLDFSK